MSEKEGGGSCMTDTRRLDWLEKEVSHGGAVVGFVHNDFCHWAVLWDGTQNLPDEDSDYGERPFPLATSFFIGEEGLDRFRPTLREAIDAGVAWLASGDEEE